MFLFFAVPSPGILIPISPFAHLLTPTHPLGLSLSIMQAFSGPHTHLGAPVVHLHSSLQFYCYPFISLSMSPSIL